jgi:hypothetical protein
MKALTLYAPWAMLMATNHKHIETRTWYTNYRGYVAIHSRPMPNGSSQASARADGGK